MRRANMRFPRIDTDYSAIWTLAEFFAQVADGGNGGASPEFYDNEGTVAILLQEDVETVYLGVAALTEPGIVFEHEDVGAGNAFAAGALGHAFGAHGGFIDSEIKPVFPDGVGATGRALQPVNGAVDLPYALGGETGGVELSVDIGGSDEILQIETFDPVLEDGKTWVRCGTAIQVSTMAVKPPRKMWVALKVRRIGGLHKGQPEALVHGIGVPEPFFAPEIGETGIHPHPSSGGDNHSVGGTDSGSSAGKSQF